MKRLVEKSDLQVVSQWESEVPIVSWSFLVTKHRKDYNMANFSIHTCS